MTFYILRAYVKKRLKNKRLKYKHFQLILYQRITLHEHFLLLTNMKIPNYPWNEPGTYRAAGKPVGVGRDDPTFAPSEQLATVRHPGTTRYLWERTTKDHCVEKAGEMFLLLWQLFKKYITTKFNKYFTWTD